MITRDELIATLPERLRNFRTIEPFISLDDANRAAAYYCAAYQEAVEVKEGVDELPSVSIGCAD